MNNMTPTEFVKKDNIKEDILISGLRNSDFDGKFFSTTLGDICIYLKNKKKVTFCIKCLVGNREYYGYVTYDDLTNCFGPAGTPKFNKISVHYLTPFGDNIGFEHRYCGIVIEVTKDVVNFYDLACYSHDLSEYDFPYELSKRKLMPCLFKSMERIPDTKG